MNLENATMTYLPGTARGTRTARVSLDRASLAALQMDRAGIQAAFARLVDEGAIQVDGNVAAVKNLLAMIEDFSPAFNVVEP